MSLDTVRARQLLIKKGVSNTQEQDLLLEILQEEFQGGERERKIAQA